MQNRNRTHFMFCFSTCPPKTRVFFSLGTLRSQKTLSSRNANAGAFIIISKHLKYDVPFSRTKQRVLVFGMWTPTGNSARTPSAWLC